MKIFVPLLLLFSLTTSSYASIVMPAAEPLATEVMIPLPGCDKIISLAAFADLSPKKYKELTGKKLNFLDKLKLNISRSYARKMIRKDGTVNMDKLKKRAGFFDRWHWHWGGFALGFLIVLGPIIALFFRDEYKWDRFWTAMMVTSSLLVALSLVLFTAGGVY